MVSLDGLCLVAVETCTAKNTRSILSRPCHDHTHRVLFLSNRAPRPVLFIVHVETFCPYILYVLELDALSRILCALAKTNPHICSKPYSEIEDYHQDLSDLIATCQRHTRCSAAYCLCTSHGVQKCRFGYPKPLQPQTSLVLGDKENDSEDQEPVLVSARNDGLINSFNPVQLSAWHANVDMQYCVSRCKVVEYVTKYATKSEPRSLPLREVYANIVYVC